MTWAAVAVLTVGVLLLVRGPGPATRRRARREPVDSTGPPMASPAAWRISSALLAITVVVWQPPGPWLVLALIAVVVLGLSGPRLVARIERGRADRDGADVALAADLVAAGLSAGVPLMGAARATGVAVGGPVGALLSEAAQRHAVGADPEAALAGLLEHPGTARLGRALLRATESGMSPVHVLQAAAAAERGRRRTDRVSRARAAGSLAALPLGLFFLPAFVLVAVVPVVVGALSTVLAPG
jgi:Flp pilus assembly protein TadB